MGIWDGGAKSAWQGFHDFGVDSLHVLVCNDETESKEYVTNEMDVRKSIVSPSQMFDECLGGSASGLPLID